MATPLLGLYTPSTGSDAGLWGDNWNNQGSTYLDNLIANITSLSLSSSNVLLTAAQARNQMIKCTGTLLANVSISPDTGVLWNGLRSISNTTSGSFTVTLTNAGGSVVIPQGRRCIVFIDTTTGPQIVGIAGTGTADPVPSGSKTLWYNTSAPSGWTAVALNDYAIKIVTNGSGGVTSGSVAYSTVFAQTVVGDTALTVDQMPLHGHPFRLGLASATPTDPTGGIALEIGSQSNFPAYTGTLSATAGQQIGGTGGGGTHNHSIELRVQTAAFVLATKD